MMESYCTILRATVGRDPHQGVTSDPFKAINDTDKFPLPCSVTQASARDMELYMQRNVEIDVQIFLLQDPGCNVNDVIDVTARDGVERRYLINSIRGSDTRSRLWECGAKQIRKPIAKDVPQ